MKRNVCFLLAVLLLLSLAACGNKDESEEATHEETMTIGIVEEDVFEIKTDYCTLKYPNVWKDTVTVEVTDDVVSFTYKSTGVRVFDVAFGYGNGEGYVLGRIKGEGEDTVVRIVDYEIDNTSAEFQTYCAIAEDANVILNHLTTDYDFELGN